MFLLRYLFQLIFNFFYFFFFLKKDLNFFKSVFCTSLNKIKKQDNVYLTDYSYKNYYNHFKLFKYITQKNNIIVHKGGNNSLYSYLCFFNVLNNNFLNFKLLLFIYFFFLKNFNLNASYSNILFLNFFKSKKRKILLLLPEMKSSRITKLKNKISSTSLSYFFFKKKFKKKITNQIKFFISDISCLIENLKFNKLNVLFLRKTKIFNKGRYSRNRQYYRTGVYWCIYINIIAVVGIYFWFYRFNINFGYMWWLLFLFIFSIFFPKIVKYRLYKISEIFKSFYCDFIWISNLVLSFNSYLFSFLKKFTFFLKLNFFFLDFFKNKFLKKKKFLIKTLLIENIFYIINLIFFKNKNYYFKYEYSNINIYFFEISKNFFNWLLRK